MIDLLSNLESNDLYTVCSSDPISLLKHSFHNYIIVLFWLLFTRTRIMKYIERNSYEFALLEYRLSMSKLNQPQEKELDAQYIGLTTYYSNFQ